MIREKAFLQVELQRPDREVTRFFWWKDITKPPTDNNIVIYRFVRVPFGIKSSPFLLSATINHHLKTSKFILAEEILKNLYVDNSLLGANSMEEAIEKYNISKEIFGKASMNLREFSSNSTTFNKFLEEKGETPLRQLKLLGIRWETQKDSMEFTVPRFRAEKITKRTILQFVAKLFDPLGLLAPITIPLKLFLQRLWKTKLSWDSELSMEQKTQWWDIVSHWNETNFILDRYVDIEYKEEGAELHCFVDASASAYGCCVYIKYGHMGSDQQKVKLLFAKSRISPMSGMTIPRLELMAILVGIRSLTFVHFELDTVKIKKVFLWSDSSCALSWLTSEKEQSIFVRNRVDEILRTPFNVIFQHVRTHENPADIISRGCLPEELYQTNLWFNGPSFLTSTTVVNKEINNESIENVIEYLYMTNEIVALSVEESSLTKLPERCSSWSSLRIIFTVLLFFIFSRLASIQNKLMWMKNTIPCVTKVPNGLDSLYKFKRWIGTKIDNLIIRLAQQQFPPSKALIKHLNLIYDEESRMWKVKSRTDRIRTRQLIYLPKESRSSQLLVLHLHVMMNHANSVSVLAELRTTCWIPKGRTMVRSTIRKLCWHCKRYTVKPFALPRMPELPSERLVHSRPFLHVGVDYLGPLLFKGEEGLATKIWVVLFTCLSSRAIHCESTTTLNTSGFLLVLRRFISRRGTPQFIISDNGPQLKLANTIMKKDMFKGTSMESIRWKFITEFSPWSGGIYERMIGLFKQSFRINVGKKLLNLEEFNTYMNEAEATVNCRPLTYLPDEPDYRPIRPIDILIPGIGEDTLAMYLDTEDIDEYRPQTSTKTSVQDDLLRSLQLADNFAQRWKTHYLTSLHEKLANDHRQPRSTARSIPSIGEIVLLQEENIPRNKWRMGKIMKLDDETNPKSAQVKMEDKSLLNRPINLLYPLELQGGISEEKTSVVEDIPVRRSDRIAKKTKPNYIFLLSILLAVLNGTTAIHCEKLKNASITKLINVDKCLNAGVALYYTSSPTTPYCWDHITCQNGVIREINETAFKCGVRCACPTWSSFCSHYSGVHSSPDFTTLQLYKDKLKLIKPIICSDLVGNTCSSNTTTKWFNIVQLFDKSTHMVESLHVAIVDTITMNSPTCHALDKHEEDTPMGTPVYCERNKCVEESKRFCYFKGLEISTIKINGTTIPIMAYGSKKVSYHDFPEERDTGSCKNCSFNCSSTHISIFYGSDTCRSEYCIYNENLGDVCSNLTQENIIPIPEEFRLVRKNVTMKFYVNGLLDKEKSLSCPSTCNPPACVYCTDMVYFKWYCSSTMEVYLSKLVLIVILLGMGCFMVMCRMTYNLLKTPIRILCIPIIYPICYVRHLLRCRKRKTQQVNEKRMSKLDTRRTRMRRMKKELLIFIIMQWTALSAEACSVSSSFQTSSQNCLTMMDGSEECTNSIVTILTMNTDAKQACFSFKDDKNRLVGTLHLRFQHIQLDCAGKEDFHTRDHQFFTPSNKRCQWRGQCDDGFCGKVKKDTILEDLPKEIFEYPGYSYCAAGCGCWACNCFTCGAACIFYRTYAKPKSSKIYRVFHCSTFRPKVLIEGTLHLTGQQPIKMNTYLHPGRSTSQSNVSLTLLSNSMPIMPILGEHFLQDIDTMQTAIIGTQLSNTMVAGTIGQFRCDSLEKARKFNCSFDPSVCSCRITEDSANCDCKHLDFHQLFKNKEKTLPLEMSGMSIRPEKNKETTPFGIHTTVTAAATVQVEIKFLNFTTSQTTLEATCTAKMSEFVGCTKCHTGATGILSCKTDFGQVTVDLVCSNFAFTVECDINGIDNPLVISTSQASLEEECTLHCPKNKINLTIKGQFSTVEENGMLHMDRIMETPPRTNNNWEWSYWEKFFPSSIFSFVYDYLWIVLYSMLTMLIVVLVLLKTIPR